MVSSNLEGMDCRDSESQFLQPELDSTLPRSTMALRAKTITVTSCAMTSSSIVASRFLTAMVVTCT